MLKLVVAGDVCMRGQEDSMDAERARSILAPVQPILDAAHIRIANWENPPTASAAEGAPHCQIRRNASFPAGKHRLFAGRAL